MKSTVMIVDDQRLNIDILAEKLNSQYKIMPATSGENAIKLLKRTKPDLVLLDVFMPGVNGFDVLKYMKQDEELAGIPVIFVTGEHNTEVEEQGLALGAVDYVKKPFNTAIVSAKVQNHLELKSYRDNLEALVKQRTIQLEERTRQLSSSHEAIIMGMSLISESHDKVTGDHISRIKEYTRILTNKMLELYPSLFTPGLAEQIVLYSPLHDIGKVSISDSILKKNGRLTHDEFKIMSRHTVEGANLLRKTESFLVGGKNSGNLEVAIEIAESHHEKYNGGGYPYGLEGDAIPLSARIVAMADVYDALRSQRPYKKAFTHKEAVSIIMLGDERTDTGHFDPKVMEAFDAIKGEFEAFSSNYS